MTSEREFIDLLQESDWTDIKAMPVQTNPNTLLEIVFIGKDQSLAIAGEDLIDSDGNEVFSLKPYVFHPGGWWAPDCDWKPVSFANTHQSLLNAPRMVQAFTSAQLQNTDESSLWSKIARISLCSATDEEMTIQSSYEYPCAIEITFEGRKADPSFVPMNLQSLKPKI